MKPFADMTEFELRSYITHLEDRQRLAEERFQHYLETHAPKRRVDACIHTMMRLRSEHARAQKELARKVAIKETAASLRAVRHDIELYEQFDYDTKWALRGRKNDDHYEADQQALEDNAVRLVAARTKEHRLNTKLMQLRLAR